jgi:CheY-like chemotaxis protein
VEHLLRNATEALAGAASVNARRIDVTLGIDSGRVTLSITDSGPGIPPSLLPHVCDPFASSKSIATGLGLGLTIVKDVVGRHHGDFALRSDASGTSVSLAFAPAEREQARGAEPPPRRVLIVDDNALVRETYAAILEASGWEVVCATDADEALSQAGAAERVDAMLVDVQLSGRDGLAIVEALARWHPRLLPRVALHTGYADEPRVQAVARRHGLVVLTKPCRAEQLVGVLTDLAARPLRP